MKKVYFLGLLAVLILTLVPAMASAHTARVECVEGNLVVTPDFLQFNPQWTVVDGNVRVEWSDGFVRTIPLPEACPTPAPVPPVPEVVPPPPVVVPPPVSPPTCAELLARYPLAGKARRNAWGCPAPPIRIVPPKRKITIRYIGCPYVGARARKVITVTLPSGKVGRVTIWGKVCKLPAVTG